MNGDTNSASISSKSALGRNAIKRWTACVSNDGSWWFEPRDAMPYPDSEMVLAADYDALAAETTAYVDRQAAHIREIDAAVQLIGNELALHADEGPAGEAFRALLNPTVNRNG